MPLATARVLPNTPPRPIVEHIAARDLGRLPPIVHMRGPRFATDPEHLVRGGKQCWEDAAETYPQRALQLQVTRLLEQFIYLQILTTKRWQDTECPLDVQTAASVHRSREQADHELALPAGHFHADVGARIRRRIQRGRLQKPLVHQCGRWLELPGQKPPIGLDMKAVDEKPFLDEYIGQAGPHVPEPFIAKCSH